MSYMTLKEAKKFIKYAREKGIKSFEFDGLKVDFSSESAVEFDKTVRDSPKKRENISEETLAQQEMDMKRQRVDELLLTDPSEYENLIAQKELTDEKTHDTRTQ